MTSLNMDGEMTGSQSLGSNGSWPLSITFLSSNQRLNDSRGGSIPERENNRSTKTPWGRPEWRTYMIEQCYLPSGDTVRGSAASVW